MPSPSPIWGYCIFLANMFSKTLAGVSALNGKFPVKNSKTMTPRDQKSSLNVWSSPFSTSGAMYAAVPGMPYLNFFLVSFLPALFALLSWCLCLFGDGLAPFNTSSIFWFFNSRALFNNLLFLFEAILIASGSIVGVFFRLNRLLVSKSRMLSSSSSLDIRSIELIRYASSICWQTSESLSILSINSLYRF